MRQAIRMTVLLLAAGLAVLAAGCGGRPTGGGPTGDSAFASVENCAAFGHLESQIVSGRGHEPGDTSSLDRRARTIQALADAAPADIKDDLETIASGFAHYVHVTKSSGYGENSKSPPTPGQRAALARAAKIL